MLMHHLVSTLYLILSGLGTALGLYGLLTLMAVRFNGLARTLQHIMSGVPTVGLATLLLLLFSVVWPVLPAGGDSRLSQSIMPATVLGFYLATVSDLITTKNTHHELNPKILVHELTIALWDNLPAFAATIVLIEWLFSRSGLGRLFLECLWGREFASAVFALCGLWVMCLAIAGVLKRWVMYRSRA